jgi:acetyl esterase
MPFDPQVQAIHDRLERDQPARLYTMSIEDARAADVASAVASAGLTEPVAEVTDRSFPGPAGQLPVRVYRPDGEGPWPVLVYFYGGGWSLGTLDTCDGVCRSLAEAGVPVELTRYDGPGRHALVRCTPVPAIRWDGADGLHRQHGAAGTDP